MILRNGVPVGILAVGDRQNVLAFKRAIDHNVNLAPVASRLFAPDFKLNAWLDAQNVPAPILGVSRDGAASVKGVAYTGAGSRSAILTLAGLTEAVLVAVAPPEMKASIGETYLSQTKVVTVGRQEGVSIPVYNSTISRRHAEISYANGQYVLRDLKSTNGTFVNGTNLEAGSVHILNPNDEVRFGDTATFAFQVRHADASSSMLLRKQAGGASLAGPPSSGNGTAAAAAGNANGSLHNESAASKTVLLNMAPGVLAQGAAASVQAQLITNADGSLMLPGAASAIPPATVAALHEAPALVAIVQGRPEVLLLKQGKHFSIGRDKANDLVLPDMSISRKHAEVFPGPDGFYIRDLGSSNGVWVNRTRIDNPYRLSHSDRVAVGNITMYFLEQRLQTGANQQIVAPSNEQAMVPSAGADATLRAPAPAKVCRHCGATSNNIARFCPSCGAPL